MAPSPILTASPASRARLRQARRYAAADATVLITGETGVGKDALARYLHAAGPRCQAPFVTIDCAALPATLLEAELFGHERGAFTDATRARAGRFEMAGQGTIYLDAVTSLTPSGQGALLRVIDERRVTRLGATVAVDVRARLIASADAAIEEMVRGGTFRADLFHRLRVLPIHILPLRERRNEIVPLARRFAAEAAAAVRRPTPLLATDAEDALRGYGWPGNVRELRHVMERVVLGGVTERVHAADLPAELIEALPAYPPVDGQRHPTLADVERHYIAVTLQRTRGNQTRAAAILGISRKALWEKRRRLGFA